MEQDSPRKPGSILQKSKIAAESDVREYLKPENIDQAQLHVEKLESKGNYIAFKIGFPYELKEKLSNENYWPTGILVRRFNFNNQGQNNKNRRGRQEPQLNS